MFTPPAAPPPVRNPHVTVPLASVCRVWPVVQFKIFVILNDPAISDEIFAELIVLLVIVVVARVDVPLIVRPPASTEPVSESTPAELRVFAPEKNCMFPVLLACIVSALVLVALMEGLFPPSNRLSPVKTGI